MSEEFKPVSDLIFYEPNPYDVGDIMILNGHHNQHDFPDGTKVVLLSQHSGYSWSFEMVDRKFNGGIAELWMLTPTKPLVKKGSAAIIQAKDARITELEAALIQADKALVVGLQAASECRLNATYHIRTIKEAIQTLAGLKL